MDIEEQKKKMITQLVSNSFTSAEYLLVFETLSKKMSVDLNLTMKQASLIDVSKTLFIAAASGIGEDEFNGLVGFILAMAHKRDIDIMDLLITIMFLSVVSTNSFRVICSDSFVEARGADNPSLTKEYMAEWLEEHLQMVAEESDSFSELFNEHKECDGKCENCSCKHGEDGDMPRPPSDKLN